MREVFVCAGNGEEFSFATPIGVGLVDSTITLSNLLAKGDIGRVIFVGSCGLYDENKELLKLYQASTVSNTEFGSLVGSFYSPIKLSLSTGAIHKFSKEELLNTSKKDLNDPRTKSLIDEIINIRSLMRGGFQSTMQESKFKSKELSRAFDPTSEASFKKVNLSPGEISIDDDEKEIFASLPKLTLNSSNYICQDANAAKIFLEHGLEMENMEGFAVARCAKFYDIEVHLILCSTNHCNSHAHELFRKNHTKAKKLLLEFVEKNFRI